MRKLVLLGAIPSEERGVAHSLDAGYDEDRAFEECKRYVGFLRMRFGEEPDGAIIKVRTLPGISSDEFDVVCEFLDCDTFEAAREYGNRLHPLRHWE